MINCFVRKFKYYLQNLILISVVLLVKQSFSQDYTQSIKGTVYDKTTEQPLTGVSIFIPAAEPIIGTISDNNGNFVLEKLNIGRYTIQASFIGYQTITIENLMLSSAKQLVLNIELEEKVYSTKEVTVKAHKDKSKPINQMATVSARSFTVEETSRYAGSFGDPARMASNYAGVVSISTERNDIVIRGNSPAGLLWRLDDVEIPNPNHFGAMGTTGGPITILNHNFLSRSDFFTGAFPAEYSNALAGVFDLNMRTGNKDKREYWAQMGWNGFELGLEGPLIKEKKASYLASYRYSMFELASKLGLDFYTPIYSDLTFKLDFPGKKYGRFNIFGIAGKSNIKLWDSDNDSTEWRNGDNGEDINFGTDFAALAFSHLYFINKKTRIKTSLSSVISQNKSRTDTFYLKPENKHILYGEKSNDIKYSLSGSLKHKANNKNSMKTGYYIDIFNVNFKDSVFKNTGFQYLSNTKGSMTMFRGYAQWQHKFTNEIVFNSGINAQYLFYNNSRSIEPRLGLRWNINNIQTINVGAGIHSQMQPRLLYFYETYISPGNYIQTNNDLKFTKSIHLILGYDHLVSENMRLKAESYYQYIYHIPIKENGFPQYSLINSGGDFWVGREDSLVNKGTGKNIGIDFTLERFFKTNYYFLITASLFNSTYIGADNIKRNTSFNQNFVINVLGGYECIVKDKNYITINLKNVFAGGKRYVPIDMQKSEIAENTVYDWSKAYKKRYANFFRIDFRIGYKINMKKTSFEIAADLQNLTNAKQAFMESYDPSTKQIKSKLQLGFLPMLTAKIEF